MRAGYLEDKFIEKLRPDGAMHERKQPLINLGTYLRTHYIDVKLHEFIERMFKSGSFEVQVLCLGAGWDTRPYRLARALGPDRVGHIAYYEIDLRLIQRGKLTRLGQGRLSEQLELVPISQDLCQWPACVAALQAAGFSTSLPTFVICELVLVYLPPLDTQAIFQWIATQMSLAEVLIVDPFARNDSFGKQMLGHFQAYKIPTQALLSYPTEEDQAARFSMLSNVRTNTMLDLYNSWLSRDEKCRLQALDWLDEMEEWNLLAQHYCFIYGDTKHLDNKQ